MYFAADGGDGAGYELWKYDGTNASRVADIRSGPEGSNPGYPAVYNDALYFAVEMGESTDSELWKYDSSGATRVADIYPYDLAVYNGALYFSAYGGAGWELWRYISP